MYSAATRGSDCELVAGSQAVEPVRRRQKGQATVEGGRVEKDRRFMFPSSIAVMRH